MNRSNLVKGIGIGVGAEATLAGSVPLLSFSAPEKGSDYSKLKRWDGKTPVDTFQNSQKARNGAAIGGLGPGSSELRLLKCVVEY